MVEAYLNQGGALDILAKSQRIPVAWFYRPPKKIAVKKYLKLIDAAKDITGDKAFGLHIGLHAKAATFDILGLALLTAKNLGEGLEQVIALEGFVHKLGTSQVLKEGGYVRITWCCNYQLHDQGRDVVESVLAGIINFSQRLVGRFIPVVEATFVHGDPHFKQVTEYRKIYKGRCYFNHSCNSILVSEEVLAWPIQYHLASSVTTTSPELREYSVPYKESVPLSQDLSLYLSRSLSEETPVLHQVAEKFHMSLRTLQRRLKREGTSYQKILAEVRGQLAKDYLRYSSMTIFDISQSLGFKEQSSFNHFFYECFNMTPSEYKKLYLQQSSI